MWAKTLVLGDVDEWMSMSVGVVRLFYLKEPILRLNTVYVNFHLLLRRMGCH